MYIQPFKDIIEHMKNLSMVIVNILQNLHYLIPSIGSGITVRVQVFIYTSTVCILIIDDKPLYTFNIGNRYFQGGLYY